MLSTLVLSCIFLQFISVQSQETNLTFILSAKNLPSKHDDHSKIDPFVKIYQTNPTTSELERVGTTEAIFDEENPEWIEVLWVLHKKGTSQKVRFEVKDKDLLDQDDAVGGAEIDLDDYVSKGENVSVALDGAEGATITMQKSTPIKFMLSARNLPKKDRPPALLAAFTSDQGESDPYVKCYFRRGIGGVDRKYATTSTIDNVVDATWGEIIEFGNYQPGTDQYWRFKVKDSDSTSKDDDVGEVILEIDQFLKEKSAKTLTIQTEDGDTGGTLTITPIF